MWNRLVVTTAGLAAALAGITVPTTPAMAAHSATTGPQTITGVPAASQRTHKVVTLGQIQTSVRSGQTAYVVASLRASGSAHVNLVDNEVRCSGAGRGDVVLGENIDPATNANPGRGDVTILNRFLVSATSTGTLTCTLYARTTSLADAVSRVTVNGGLRFAATDVGEDATGTAMQSSLGNGNTIVDQTVRTPILDRRIGAGHTQLAVGADVEYMSCARTRDTAGCPSSSDTSGARFTLFAHQMKGNQVCASAKPAQTSVAVSKQVHHRAIPLYTKISLTPGCDRVYAYVRAERTAGPPGAIQGRADNLTNQTGATGTGQPDHDSTMTHLFAIPS